MFKNLQQRKKKGQTTIEYIIVVTGVIAVIIIFFGPGGPFRTAYNNTMTYGTNGMDAMANRLNKSH